MDCYPAKARSRATWYRIRGHVDLGYGDAETSTFPGFGCRRIHTLRYVLNSWHFGGSADYSLIFVTDRAGAANLPSPIDGFAFDVTEPST